MKTITLKFSPLVAALRIRATNAYREIRSLRMLNPSDLILDGISVKKMFLGCSDYVSIVDWRGVLKN